MIPTDINQTAMLMITNHQDDAYERACQRSMDLAKENDTEGAKVFFDVARAILRLQNTSNSNEH